MFTLIEVKHIASHISLDLCGLQFPLEIVMSLQLAKETSFQNTVKKAINNC